MNKLATALIIIFTALITTSSAKVFSAQNYAQLINHSDIYQTYYMTDFTKLNRQSHC